MYSKRKFIRLPEFLHIRSEKADAQKKSLKKIASVIFTVNKSIKFY
jgi:hypothetical protein